MNTRTQGETRSPIPTYDPQRLADVLCRLMAERNESMREASLRAGVDRGTLGRILREGKRPSVQTVILLANHFGLHPNDLLVMAGYPPLEIFRRATEDPASILDELRDLSQELQAIRDPLQRKRVVEAVRTLLHTIVSAPPDKSEEER